MTSTLESALELSVAVTDPASVSRSVRKTFVEPLSPEDQLFIKWLSDRYEGRSGAPVMAFSCDGILTLVVPTDLQRKRADDKQKPVEAERILPRGN